MENNSDQSSQQLGPPTELVKLRFDFAWKWFSFHADQRVKMFNFMLIVFGIFATAVVTSIDKHLARIIPISLCIIAAILALIFVRLDRRNRDLVWLGEDVLIELERENIFGKSETIKIYNRKRDEALFGILWRQAREEEIRGASWWRDAWLGKHRVWLGFIGYMFALSFAGAAFWICMQNIQPSDSIWNVSSVPTSVYENAQCELVSSPGERRCGHDRLHQ